MRPTIPLLSLLAVACQGATIEPPNTFRPTPSGGFRSTAVGFTAELRSDGLSLNEGALRLQLEGFGRVGSVNVLPSTIPTQGGCAIGAGPCVVQIERSFATIKEWWVPRAGALQQGWTIPHPPQGAGSLELRVSHTGQLLQLDSEGAVLMDQRGTLWTYEDLSAWDTHGTPLPITLSQSDGELVLQVDDTDAAYPVWIDPTISSGETKLTGASLNGAEFGASVAGVGDINGDGYDDVIIGAPRYSFTGGTNSPTGAAFLFYGSTTGLANNGIPINSNFSQPGQQFGYAVAGVGDLDQDGFDDVAIGAPFRDEGPGPTVGAVFLFHGSSVGLQREVRVSPSNLSSGDHFGSAIAGPGDLNDDGYPDLLVGAPQARHNRGAVLFFSGGPAGLFTAAGTYLDNPFEPDTLELGAAVASAGDVNADGIADAIIGATVGGGAIPPEGKPFVLLGSPGPPLPLQPLWVPIPNPDNGRYVAGVGDTNGDGFDDVLMGSGSRVFIFYGSPSGDLHDWMDIYPENTGFVSALSGLGDLNQDGYADFGIASDRAPLSGTEQGLVNVYYGGPRYSNAPSSPEQLSPHIGVDYSNFGTALASAGDTNGDGRPDIIVGAPFDHSVGAAYAFLGCNALRWYPDVDGDGFGDPNNFVKRCEPPQGYVGDSTDCDDQSVHTYPGAPELPNDGVDQDCDSFEECFQDADGDGFTSGPVPSSFLNCDGPDDRTAPSSPLDCDDTDPATNPQGTERCDGADNDCDGLTDGDDPSLIDPLYDYWPDADGDGVGVPTALYIGCLNAQPSGYALASTHADCDDADPHNYPGGTEVCDGADNDCDTIIDNGLLYVDQWPDLDGDGFGDTAVPPVSTCNTTGEYVRNNLDCDDTDPHRYTDAPELCNQLDDDCDTIIDEGLPTFIAYPDLDGDGYGDSAASPTHDCILPAGSVEDHTDCDDTDPHIHPGAVEDPHDQIDSDCGGEVEEPAVLPDSDSDGIPDAIDPAPQSAGGATPVDPPEPDFGCGCMAASSSRTLPTFLLFPLRASRQ